MNATTARPVARSISGEQFGGSRAIAPGELAWIAGAPAALALVTGVVLLGPPLGSVLDPSSPVPFWASQPITPEPVEQARYLLAVLAVPLFCGLVALLARKARPRRPATAVAVVVSQVMLLGFVLLMVVAQQENGGSKLPVEALRRAYFTVATLVASAIVAGLAIALLRSDAVVRRLRSAVRDTWPRRIVAGTIAVLFVATWLLTSFNTEGSIGRATLAVRDNFPFWLDETFAVLNGRAPLVDYHAQYGQLWPDLIAGVMALLGPSFGVYAGTMVAGTAAVLLAVYALLRRVARSALVALALFLPFVATGFFLQQGTLENRYTASNLFSLFPMRYGGPYVLAWLLIRHLTGGRPRRGWPLFPLAGLVVINNIEFGVPAFAATLAALLCVPPHGWRRVGRLVAAAVAGLALAAALVVLLTLALAGEPPRFGLMLEFSRVYGIGGFGMMPMPAVGFHLAIYVTFAAAVVVATTRAIGRQRDVALTAALCWIGVFGLGAGGYYAGRSHPEVLIDLFSPWTLALVLLLVVAVRAILRRPLRLPTAAEVALLLGFGLAVCSLAQTPAPGPQLARLRDPTPHPIFRPTAQERLIRRWTVRGERVAILVPLGHRIAYDLALTDIMPYAHIDSMPSVSQWETAVRVFARRHVRKLIVFIGRPHPPTPEWPEGSPRENGQIESEQLQFLLRSGWQISASDPRTRIVLMRPSRPLNGA